MKELNELKAEVSDLKDSLEFTDNVIEKKVEKLETKLILKIKFTTAGTTRSLQTIFNIN